MTEEERQRAIWMKLARMAPPSPPREGSVPTGFRALDEALGGGLPRAAMVELYGPSVCGKTTLTIQVAAHLQRDGLTCAWIDADRTFDPSYAERLGARVDRIPLAQPDSAEDAFAVVRTLVASGAVDLVVVDSAAALVPRLEMAAGISYYSKGLHSRVTSSVPICGAPWPDRARAWYFSIKCAIVPLGDRAKPARVACLSNFSLPCASRWCPSSACPEKVLACACEY